MKHVQVKQGKVHVNRSRTQTNKGLGSDHPENDTTTVTNTTGYSRQCISAPLNTLDNGMSLRSRIPTSTRCKENKHCKHVQTQRTRRHGQDTYK